MEGEWVGSKLMNRECAGRCESEPYRCINTKENELMCWKSVLSAISGMFQGSWRWDAENVLSVHELPVSGQRRWSQRGDAAGCSVWKGGRDPEADGAARGLHSDTGQCFKPYSSQTRTFQNQISTHGHIWKVALKICGFNPPHRTAVVLIFDL